MMGTNHSARLSSVALASSQALAFEAPATPNSSFTDTATISRSRFSISTTTTEQTNSTKLPHRNAPKSSCLVMTGVGASGPQNSLPYLQSIPMAKFLRMAQPIWQSQDSLARTANHCLPSYAYSMRSLKRMERGRDESLSVNQNAKDKQSPYLTSLHWRYFPLRSFWVVSQKEHLGMDLAKVSAELDGMTMVLSDRDSRILMDYRYSSTEDDCFLLICKAIVLMVQYSSPIQSNALVKTSPFWTICTGKAPKNISPLYYTSPPRQPITVSPMYPLYFLKLRSSWLLA